MELLVGASLLFLIVGVQIGFQHWKSVRIRRAWQTAEQAIRVNEYDRAEDALRRCIKIMPLWLAPRTLLAVVLAERGALVEAEEALQLVTSLEPKNAEGYVSLGVFYARYQPDRIADIAEALATAISHKPELQQRLRHEKWLDPLRNTPELHEILEP